MPTQVRLVAPLLFARDSVIVTVHLCAKAIVEKELCFFAGCHLGAVNSAVALVLLRCDGRCDRVRRRDVTVLDEK